MGLRAAEAELQLRFKQTACVVCIWNEANAQRAQHGLPAKDFHISLTPGDTNLGRHSLSMLLPDSPFQLDEGKLIQVGLSLCACRKHRFGQFWCSLASSTNEV